MLYPIQNNVRNRLDLSGLWDFKIDPDEVGEHNGWFNGISGARPIAVPGSWNDQYEDLYLYLGMGWYTRTPKMVAHLLREYWARPSGGNASHADLTP